MGVNLRVLFQGTGCGDCGDRQATFGQPTDETFQRAIEYLCSPKGAGCAEAVITAYEKKWGGDSFTAILEGACKNEDVICAIDGFNYEFGYQEVYSYGIAYIENNTWYDFLQKFTFLQCLWILPPHFLFVSFFRDNVVAAASLHKSYLRF